MRLTPDDPSVEFPDVEEVRLSRRGQVRTLRIASLRAADDVYLIAFEGITDRDVVRDTLSGGEVLIPRPESAEAGEAFVYELEGARVVDATGTVYGVVAAVLDGAAQDILSIKTDDGSELLLPMVPATIGPFDRKTHTLTIMPIPGLWD